MFWIGENSWKLSSSVTWRTFHFYLHFNAASQCRSTFLVIARRRTCFLFWDITIAFTILLCILYFVCLPRNEIFSEIREKIRNSQCDRSQQLGHFVSVFGTTVLYIKWKLIYWVFRKYMILSVTIQSRTLPKQQESWPQTVTTQKEQFHTDLTICNILRIYLLPLLLFVILYNLF